MTEKRTDPNLLKGSPLEKAFRFDRAVEFWKNTEITDDETADLLRAREAFTEERVKDIEAAVASAKMAREFLIANPEATTN